MSIELGFLMDVSAEVGEPLEIGSTPMGFRRVVPILGGTFEGPRLKGRILPGGADWQLIRPDGVAELEARYTVQTDDGSLISIVNRGYRHGPEEVIRKLASGILVDPSEYYFRSVPQFTVSEEKYSWLNNMIFVGSGVRHPSMVQIKFFEVK